MPTPLAIPAIIIGIVIFAGVVGTVAFQSYSQQAAPSPNPLTEPVSTASPSAMTSPLAVTPSAPTDILAPITSRQPLSLGVTSTSSIKPLVSPSSPKNTTSTPPTVTQTAPTIRFFNLPTSVRSGQSFTVAWQIDAPQPVAGSNTTLKVERHGGQQTGSSRSNSDSTSSQSYGSFTTPAQFDANFKFAGDPGDIEVEVSATINGQTITKQATINFET